MTIFSSMEIRVEADEYCFFLQKNATVWRAGMKQRGIFCIGGNLQQYGDQGWKQMGIGFDGRNMLQNGEQG